MPIQSSFATVAEQIAAFNKNIIEILSKINSLSTTTDSNVDIRVFDENGVLTTYSLPSFTYLKSEIERLNNSINSLYSIDTTGALIQTTSQNQFKKIITVDLNREPLPINTLSVVTSFKSTKNWFFDGLLNPSLLVEFDLSGKIENNVRKALVRRYIVDFARNSDGTFTNNGQSALNSFNSLFRQQNSIDIQDFERWYRTTPGIVEPLNPKYDEQMFDLEANTLLYDGTFNVLSIEEDRLNKKLWYRLNTLDYLINETLEIRQLSIGTELIINTEISNTRYKIIEISTTESNPRIRVERIEGLQPIPVGINTLKIYSPVIYTKRVRVSIGYNERSVIFIKAVNADNNLVAKDWSLGTGFYSNDLVLNSSDSFNGQTLEQYYQETVYDYGVVLQDLVAKKLPNTLAGIPQPPVIDTNNFKVVQINKHLTDSVDANLLKNKHNYATSLKNEIRQIQEAIDDRNKKLRVVRFSSAAERKKFELEIEELNNKKVSKSRLLATTTQEIIDLSRSNLTRVEPKFRLRGFWNIPEAVQTRGTLPQEIIQFLVEYRYTSKDGREPSIESFNVVQNNTQKTAAFSNWTPYKTDVRKRIFDKSTGEYTWVVENVEDADTPNINQLDIPISKNERVEFRIKSISEVGWPESPVESDWTPIYSFDFPDDLNNVLDDNDFIFEEANKEDVKISLENELAARGLDQHLSETLTVNSKTYYHTSESILSGFRDENGAVIDLYRYLQFLEARVLSLEEKVKRAKGILQIILIRNNQEFVIGNNSETQFNIECEEFLEPFSGDGIPTGRVYANNIYVIKDFALKIRNNSNDSPLGLLSGRIYANDSQIYNDTVPQCFWVNNKDELIFSDISGVSKTQLNNQFVWSINYESVTSQTNVVTRLTENIGNTFLENSSNSITDTLALSEYNLGYSENQSLAFNSTNNSLLDVSKWVDRSVSVASTTKFLTTIHPVVDSLDNIIETNSDKIKILQGNSEIVIPINIYFKMNALDNTQGGVNYEWINLNNQTQTVKHIKKLKFLLENEAENKPFNFTLIFNLNRNKVTFSSKSKNYTNIIK